MALDPLLAPLIKGFALEAAEIAEGVTRHVLDLERATEVDAAMEEAYREVARGLHTLKGTAGSLGLASLSSLAHKLEEVFAPARAERRPLPSEVADRILRGLDGYLTALRSVADGGDDVAADRAIDALEAPPSDEGAAESAPTSSDMEEHDVALRVDPKRAVELLRRVEALRELRLQLGERRDVATRALAAAARLPRAQSGELRTELAALERGLGADEDVAAELLLNLEEALQALLLQPLRSVLDPLQRGLRDQCRATGKEAALSIVGAELSVDRRILEAVRASVSQLLRNAVDHGIERPDDRRRVGKHREGSIVVRVTPQGNLVAVEVSDDGGGLDLERIRAVAVERKIVAADVAAGLTEADLADLIFAPGFSTRSEITGTSGRGVGLDLVRERIEVLGGTVTVETRAGQGTRFILELPMEFGSSPLMVVAVGDHEVALPMLAIETVVRSDAARLVEVRGELRYRADDELIPVLDLAAALGLRVGRAPEVGGPILIVQTQGRRAALVVDAVKGERDLSVQALPIELRSIPAYQGVSMEADGRLVLVVKAEWVTSAKIASSAPERRALVIDDSLTARSLHRAILEAGGFVVHTTSSAELGLKSLEGASYEVVVCDVTLGGMDGLTFASTVRRMPERAGTPIVLVSSRDDAAIRKESIARGADAFVTKAECAAGRLLAEVRTAVGRRKGAA